MLRRTALSLVATVIALTALGMSPATRVDAFAEGPFIQVWNANQGVIEEALERYFRVPSRRLEIRLLREIARAENRVIVWLQKRPATVCQRPFEKIIISRGTVARKSFKAAARAVSLRQDKRALTLLQRGLRFELGRYKAAAQMVETCP